MSCKPDIQTTVAMYAVYQGGKSLSEVGAAFGVSRQTIYERFHARGMVLRPKPTPLPFVEYKGNRYSPRANGYWAKTQGDREYLHRQMWIDAYGHIPVGFDVHHMDEDKSHNTLANFELLTKSDHGKRHGFRGNQYTGSLRAR